jgi:hypothetical protein
MTREEREEWEIKIEEKIRTFEIFIREIKDILYGQEVEGLIYGDKLEEIKQAIKDLEEELMEEF